MARNRVTSTQLAGVPMSEMKRGDIAKIIATRPGRETEELNTHVLKTWDGDVVVLEDGNVWFKDSLATNGTRVQILPPGTVVTLTVGGDK